MIKHSFSIIVPVYNTALFLEKCLTSLQNQNYDNFEVILIDDESTDRSFEICCQYQMRDNRFLAFSKINEGQGVARNFGLSKAKNDFVLYVDSDDTIDAKTLTEINAALNTNPDADIINFLINFVDDNGKVYHQSCDFSVQSMVGDDIFYSAMLDKDVLSSPCNKAYRRNFLVDKRIQFPSLRKNEDILYSRMVSYYAQKAIFINQVFYHALIRPDSTSRNVTEQNFIDSINSVLLLKDFLQDKKIYEKCEALYKAFVVRHISYLVILSAFKTSKYRDFKTRYRMAIKSEFGEAMKKSKIIKYLSVKQKIMVYLCHIPFLLYVSARIVLKLSIYNPGR